MGCFPTKTKKPKNITGIPVATRYSESSKNNSYINATNTNEMVIYSVMSYDSGYSGGGDSGGCDSGCGGCD